MSDQNYCPIVMTHEAEPIAVIIDVEAFEVVRATLDQLQRLRTAGTLTAPAAWLQMRAEMVADGYAEKFGAIV